MFNKRVLFMLLCIILPIPWLYAQTFTFIQVSDVHTPYSDSVSFVRSIKDVGPIYLAPYNVTSLAPSFVVATGDVTEYGGGEGWASYISACHDTGLTWYHMAGNHDNTWWCIRPDIRKENGAPYYSFDYQGCHFIILDSATPQDPRPSFGREEIEWLKSDVSKIDQSAPVFVLCHHPLGGSEFISSYEQTRVLDILAPYNVVAFITGHYHSPKLIDYNGYPVIVGGQGYSPSGYNVFCIQDGYLRVAYRKTSEPNASVAIFEKDIRARKIAPPVNVSNMTYSKGALNIEYQVSDSTHEPANLEIRIDNRAPVTFNPGDRQGTTQVMTQELTPGWHFATLSIQSQTSKTFLRSFKFEVRGDRKLWETQLPGAFKSGPVLGDCKLYIGGNDGKIYAINKLTGSVEWSFQTGGEILGKILLTSTTGFVASSDGKIYAFAHEGPLCWVKDLGVPVYAPPVISGDNLIICDRQGRVMALNQSTGEIKWEKRDATYTIESCPFIYEDEIYLGAWDCYIYKYKIQDGTLVWKTKGVGSATKPAPRYYSPADCGPVFSQGKLYVTDRAYILGEWDANGTLLRNFESVSAVSLSEDAKSLYLRKTTGELAKMAVGGEIIWSTPNLGDSIPACATEFGGRVYTCSGGGLLSAVDACDGKILWQYQVTPSLRVYGQVTADATGVYVSDMDGKVTALAIER